MPKQVVPFLPPTSELQKLEPATVQLVIESFNAELRRQHSYTVLGMICGTLSFAACIGAFTILALNGHLEAAALVLGAGVLAIVGRMIAARL